METPSKAKPNRLLIRARQQRGWSQKDVADKIGVETKSVGRWERGEVFPMPYYRQKLLTLFEMPAEELGLLPKDSGENNAQDVGAQFTAPSQKEIPPQSPQAEEDVDDSDASIFNVPYRRNLYFTGREDTLEQLHEALVMSKAAALTQTQAISGMGGIGKTQTAIEYAYRYRNEYQAVLWAGADRRETLVNDFVNIAKLLKLPEKDKDDQNSAVKAVKRWLEKYSNWLLILDNADDLNVTSDFLPMQGTGHILLTTREQVTGTFAQAIRMEKMEAKEGTLFLLRRSKIIGLYTPLDAVSYSDWTSASAIVELMDGLPLALDQAGAYIEETSCGLTGYLKHYEKRHDELLSWRGKFATDHPESVATTWSLSFEKVERTNPVAADLLRLCAFLYPDAIPEELFIDGKQELGQTLATVAEASVLDGAISDLRRFSLLKRDPDEKILVIHRLVQAVIRDGMDKDTQRLWAERAIRAVNCCFPDVDYATWPRCQRFLQHAQLCAELVKQWNMVFPEVAHLLHVAGIYLTERAQYIEAEALLKQSLALYEQLYGANSLDVADSLDSLTSLYFNQGLYEQSIPLSLQVLEIREQILGSSHTKIAESLNNLAMLHLERGNYTQAESFAKRALKIWEDTLGPDHQDTSHGLNNLALIYYDQKQYEQAEPLYLRALSIRERVLGKMHPLVALTLNNLGALYRNMGEYARAEPFFKRALAIREETLPPRHPDIATSMNNLARLYRDQNKNDLAEPFLQQALEIREQALGPQHPDVGNSLHSLGVFYKDQGEDARAEALFRRALAIRLEALGADHPETIQTLQQYSEVLRKMNRESEAVEVETRLLPGHMEHME